jgi:hypothetical protein
MTTTSTDAFLRAALEEDGAFCAAGRPSRKSVSLEPKRPDVQSADYGADETKSRPVECHESSLPVPQPNVSGQSAG